MNWRAKLFCRVKRVPVQGKSGWVRLVTHTWPEDRVPGEFATCRKCGTRMRVLF